jgi:hypothetical protein
MVIEQTLERLATALRTVEECVQSVILTVAEDHPTDEPLLVADLEDKLRDVSARSAEAADLASILTSAASDPPSPSELRRGLARCHTLHLEISRVVRDDLLSWDQGRQIRQLASTRRGAWVPWARAVSVGLAACREPMWAVDEALLDAWQTLADRHGGTDVSVRTIGQQVRLHG